MIENNYLEEGKRTVSILVQIDGKGAFYKKNTWKEEFREIAKHILNVVKKVDPDFNITSMEEVKKDGKITFELNVTEENQWFYQLLYQQLKADNTRIRIVS